VPISASPFTAKVPRDGTMHQIEVEGPGLAPQKKAVTYDKDVSLIVTLAAEPVASATAAPDTSTKPTPGFGQVRTGPRPPPDDDLDETTKTTREIDEQDPYKK
jgi:hypothetical protein